MTVQSFLSRVSSAAIAVAIVASSAPALAASAPAPAANGWGVKLTDVTPDPAIRYGTLPNGMKYAIMHNATPKGTASVRLRFEFGSIGENDNERGLAHFIEHMAFNGSTHVPEGDMVKILERQGLEFGPDTNAQTGFDTTTYMLDLPKADAEHIDTALFLFREVASELKFDPGAVDRERGVILGEERARDNFQLHQFVDMMGFDYPKRPIQPPPDRRGFGSEERASADTIRRPLSPLLPSRRMRPWCSSATPTRRSSRPRSRRRSPTGRAAGADRCAAPAREGRLRASGIVRHLHRSRQWRPR